MARPRIGALESRRVARGALGPRRGTSPPRAAASSVSATVSAPAFSPLGGTYISGQEITISSTTSGASIYLHDGRKRTDRIFYPLRGSCRTGIGRRHHLLHAQGRRYKSGSKASDLSTAAYAIQRASVLQGPQDVSISVSGPSTIYFGSSGTFTATAAIAGAAVAMDSFAWYLDGELVSGQTSSSISVSADSSSGGSHRLAAIAALEGYYYSGEATYTAREPRLAPLARVS